MDVGVSLSYRCVNAANSPQRREKTRRKATKDIAAKR